MLYNATISTGNKSNLSVTRSESRSLCLWLTITTQNDFKIDFGTYDEAHLPLLHKIYHLRDVLFLGCAVKPLSSAFKHLKLPSLNQSLFTSSLVWCEESRV